MGKGPILDGTAAGGPTNGGWDKPLHEFIMEKMGWNKEDIVKHITALDYYNLILGSMTGQYSKVDRAWGDAYDCPLTEADVEYLIGTRAASVSYDDDSGFDGDIGGQLSVLAFWACGYRYDGGKIYEGGQEGEVNAMYAHHILKWMIDATAESGTNHPYYKRDEPSEWQIKALDWAVQFQGCMSYLDKDSSLAAKFGPFGGNVNGTGNEWEYVPKKYKAMPFIQRVWDMMKSDTGVDNAFNHERDNITQMERAVNLEHYGAVDLTYSGFKSNVMAMLKGGGYPTITHYLQHTGTDDDESKGNYSDAMVQLTHENANASRKYRKMVAAEAAEGTRGVIWHHREMNIGDHSWDKLDTLGRGSSDDGQWFMSALGFCGGTGQLNKGLGPEAPDYLFQGDRFLYEDQRKVLRMLWRGRTLEARDGWGWSVPENVDDFSDSEFRPADWNEIVKEDLVFSDEVKKVIRSFVPTSVEIYFDDSKSDEEIALKDEDGVAVKTHVGGTKKIVIGSSRLTGDFVEDSGEDTWWPGESAEKAIWDLFKEMADPKGPKRRLPIQWFQKNFGDAEAPYPGSAQEASETLGLIDQRIVDVFKANGKKINLQNAKLFKSSDAFTDRTGNYVFGEKLFRRFYFAAYVNTVFYFNHIQSKANRKFREQGKKTHSAEEIMRWTAFRAAVVMNMLWTQYVHDHSIGNLYGLLVAYYHLDPAIVEMMPDINLALLEDAQEAAEDGVANMAEATIEPPPEGETAQRQREKLYKQCALLLNMDRLYSHPTVGNLPEFAHNKNHVWHRITKDKGYGSYNDRVLVVQSQLHRQPGEKPAIQSNNLLNKMIAPRAADIERFLDLKTAEAANLMPYIRLFKVWNDDAGKQVQREFKFQMNPDESRITGLPNRGFDRGDGVGLKEFSWEYDGETPATATKYIKAKMTLVFQNFEDFTRLRRCNDNGPEPKSYRYVDLFVSPTNMNQRHHFYQAPHALQYDPNYYRIKVEVGYSPTGLPDANLARAIQHINRSFYLVLIDNEISINEDMTVSITANYRAYIEEAMDSYKFNALTNPDIMLEREQLKKAWNKALGDEKAICSPKQLGEVRELIDKRMANMVKRAHQTIMMNLLEHDRLYWVDFKKDDIDRYRSAGFFDKIPDFKNSDKVSKASMGTKEKFKEWVKAQEGKDVTTFTDPEKPAGNYRCYFFYLGDLVYSLMSNLYGEVPTGASSVQDPLKTPYAKSLPGAENTKICLLDFEYHVSLDEANPNKVMNIADIPISSDFFVQWYTDTIIKGDITTMPIGAFIKRLLVELISEALAESCVAKSPDHRVTFRLGSFLAGGIQTGPAKTDPYIDPITYMMFDEKETRFDVSKFYNRDTDKVGLPLLNHCKNAQNLSAKYRTDSPIHGQFNYLFIYADYENPAHPGRGMRGEDHAGGCFHVNIGRDVGIVKKVAFSKSDIKYLRESRMANQGQAGLLQLSAVYNSTVDMIGNTLFLPGMEFWLDPYGFGGPKFGMPQDPPLTWMASGDTIDTFNEMVDETAKDEDGFTKEELQAMATGVNGVSYDGLTKPPENKKLEIGSYANVMGIGGYQLITKVSCKIAPGEYSTTVEARHVYTGYPRAKNPEALYEAMNEKDITSPSQAQPNNQPYCTKLEQHLQAGKALTDEDIEGFDK